LTKFNYLVDSLFTKDDSTEIDVSTKKRAQLDVIYRTISTI